MKSKTPHLFLLLFLFPIGVTGCKQTLVVKNVDYSQQVESVLVPDEKGMVTDIRYGISYSVLPIQYQEFNDSSSVLINEIRMIRNAEGFYFITANNFKNVYVFRAGKGEFKLERTILITEEGLNNPALNWRKPLIQIVSANDEVIFVDETGIINEQEGQS